MGALTKSLLSTGSTGHIIDIECHLSNNLPTILIVGFANKAVNEAKDRLRGAFANSHLSLPRRRITINLAPADLPKTDSCFDLAIALAILVASQQTPLLEDDPPVAVGELGLDGSVRAVRGIIGKLLAGRERGLHSFFIPVGNMPQAQLVPHITLYPIASLAALHEHLSGISPIQPVKTGRGLYADISAPARPGGVCFSDIAGQSHAKRALMIAAAGGHNVLLSGPPGTGKSMLAKALPSILPPLEREEMLEVTHLHSLAGNNYEQVISDRPFRSPHHSASHTAMVGGGAMLRPGEISLSHRGVLFLDELPEFSRQTLEALRQPLEDRTISVARLKDVSDYPANFMLIATANPCPCGYYGTERPCRCDRGQIKRYRHKLSGPIIDRLDLFAHVQTIEHQKLLTASLPTSIEAKIGEAVTRARQRQAERFQANGCLNSDMTNADIRRQAHLQPEAAAILATAASRYGMSARAYMRTIKVARTIADLDNAAAIAPPHITEALTYRAPGAIQGQPV